MVSLEKWYSMERAKVGFDGQDLENAIVEIPDGIQARPIGKIWLSVTIGEHVFTMSVDEVELIDALASQDK